ncbi:hypothetical protein D3C72_2289300 [compost metagenome]
MMKLPMSATCANTRYWSNRSMCGLTKCKMKARAIPLPRRAQGTKSIAAFAWTDGAPIGRAPRQALRQIARAASTAGTRNTISRIGSSSRTL